MCKNISVLLTDFLKASDLDALIIAGDLFADSLKSSYYVSDLNRLLNFPVFWIPGNHEFYGHKNSSSLHDYDFLKSDEFCLIGKTVSLGNAEIAGNPAWYDYSFAQNPFLSKLMWTSWSDSRFCDFEYFSNEEINSLMLADFECMLKNMRPDSYKIAVTHMVPFKKLLKWRGKGYEITDGYFGSMALGKLLLKYNVNLAVFGHTHIPMQGKLKKSIQYLCCPLGYHFEWKQNDFCRELNDRLKIITV